MRYVGRRDEGFTMVELLLVIITVAVIGVVALPQFTDFRKEARAAASSEFVNHLRSAIANKKTQILTTCGAPLGAWPSLTSILINDVTEAGAPGAICTQAQITDPEARKFLASSTVNIPVNPYTGLATFVNCVCTDMCDATCSSTVGFCYSQTTGKVWGYGLDVSCGPVASTTTTTTTTTTTGSTTTTTGGSTGGGTTACTPGTSYTLDSFNLCRDDCTTGIVTYSLCNGGGGSTTTTGGSTTTGGTTTGGTTGAQSCDSCTCFPNPATYATCSGSTDNCMYNGSVTTDAAYKAAAHCP